jgi:predicted molibdopterin-dependent oxidoreductase YjgC
LRHAEFDVTGALRIAHGVTRGPAVTITVDGRPIAAFPGESVATALLAAGIRQLRRSAVLGAPRGPFCLMGVCQDCLVTVDGRAVLGCQVAVVAGMRIATEQAP